MVTHSELMIPYLKQVNAVSGLALTEQQFDCFAKYDDFLIDYNSRMNLTRITDPREVAVKHFGDSLTLLSHDALIHGGKVIDIGAGAGFPGVPLAIARPDLRITLVDSLRKRTAFLTELVQHLRLHNVEVVWGRAEEIGQNPKFRGQFDVVIARAVAALNVLVELCLPLAKQTGCFLALKGPKAEAEIADALNAIKLLGGYIKETSLTKLPLVDEARCLVCIGKNAVTPRNYPRKAGLPERQPL